MKKLILTPLISALLNGQFLVKNHYLEPTREAGAALLRRNIPGPVVMLNLLRLREYADYTENPGLAPETGISGREALQKYIDHTRPFLRESGGEILLLGEGGHFFIGPGEEQWDVVLLVRQRSVADFIAFASHPGYLAGIGHRTAALADSRLLPITEYRGHDITNSSGPA